MTKRVTLTLRVSPASSGGKLISAAYICKILLLVTTHTSVDEALHDCHVTVIERFACPSDRRSYVVLYLLSGVSEEHVLDLCLPPPKTQEEETFLLYVALRLKTAAMKLFSPANSTCHLAT